jgi:MtaA/CmuA family methyltransferase
MHDGTSPRERLKRVIAKQPVDRAPVAFVGGMMNAALVDIMRDTDNPLPEAYDDAAKMAQLAADVSAQTGFENLALPFCMTLEAELLGSSIDRGSLSCEAKVVREVFRSVRDVRLPELTRLPAESRAARVVKAIELTAKRKPDAPIFGSLTGPVSTTASVVEPMVFLKELRKDRENCHRVIEHVVRAIFVLAREMVEGGADYITISDPTATGEILGPRAFEEYALRYLNRLIDGIHGLGAKVLVHICGNVGPVEHLVAQLHGEVISTDAQVNLSRLKRTYPHLVTMGNVSTTMLQFSEPERIVRHTRQLLDDGVDIIAPACGIGTTTPLANVKAMTETVKDN